MDRQTPRITECFVLEGTFRHHLTQSPYNKQGHLQLHQVAQSPVQPGLESLQGWGIDHLSGEPGPGFHHLHCKKKIFLISSLNLPSLSLKPLPLVLSQQTLLEVLSSTSL